MKTFIILLGFILTLGGITHAAEPVLRVSAAASLADALKKINTLFSQQTGINIQLNLGASSTLARQIEEGAPMDIFISADLAKIDKLDAKGLLQLNTRKNLLSNSLVIVIPSDSALSINSLTDLTNKTISKIATGDPKAVPVGIYAKTYLEKAGLWQSIQPKIVASENVRAALAAVESGNIDVGIVYKTDAAISQKVKVAYEVPIDPTLTITYPMAALKNAPNPALALQYLEYLDTPSSKATFTQFGFIVLPETDANAAR